MPKYIFIFLVLLIFNPASADEIALKKEALPNNRVIKITGHPHYPPFVWKDNQSNKLTGIAIEMLQKAFNEINVKVEVVSVDTWGRAQEEVKLGHVDLLTPPYKTEERENFYKFSKQPMFIDETVLFVKKGKEFIFKNFSDLKAYKGVAIINDSFGTEFDNYDQKELKILRLKTTEQCFSFLEAGRADYLVAGIYSGMDIVNRRKIKDKIVILPKRVIVTGMYSPISLKSKWNRPDIEKYLDRKFVEYAKNGLLKELQEKYHQTLKDSP